MFGKSTEKQWERDSLFTKKKAKENGKNHVAVTKTVQKIIKSKPTENWPNKNWKMAPRETEYSQFG